MQFDDANLIPQKAIYKWYIHCQLGDYIAPTTYERNQETPLIFLRVGSTTQIRWLWSFKAMVYQLVAAALRVGSFLLWLVMAINMPSLGGQLGVE